MSDFRRVNDRLSVSPQLSVQDVNEAAAKGFKTIINNRPDGEAPDQPTSAEIEAAAKAAGLNYVHIPVRGMPPSPDLAEQTCKAVESSPGPVLAFCRTGTRSISCYSIGQHMQGRDREELVATAANAGYDLSNVLPA
ncbi:MAG: TIGR01244 family sulfur transferase [Parcubacteria group bacterium]